MHIWVDFSRIFLIFLIEVHPHNYVRLALNTLIKGPVSRNKLILCQWRVFALSVYTFKLRKVSLSLRFLEHCLWNATIFSLCHLDGIKHLQLRDMWLWEQILAGQGLLMTSVEQVNTCLSWDTLIHVWIFARGTTSFRQAALFFIFNILLVKLRLPHICFLLVYFLPFECRFVEFIFFYFLLSDWVKCLRAWGVRTYCYRLVTNVWSVVIL